MHRIAILNRGEPALRFLRALREYNIEHSTQMIGVAFFTEPDRHAPFVRFADVSVFLGEPMRKTESGASISTYCDHDFVIQQLVKHKCDAVWPGWGFVSEDAGFVGKLEKEGILFIGPSSDAMYRLGDKIASKYMAEACMVPLASWAEVDDDDEQHSIFKQASRIGYPLMVKASAGGGGRGIIKVNREEELLSALYKVREAVAKVFGQGGILMEACVTNARHVEVQFVVNTLGRAFSLGVRDCSIQRKNQKVIEETPSPILPSEIEDELCRVTARLAQHAGYVGVGTAEYLYHPKTKVCTFLEVNSRLQVEHTITELVTGCDLVKAQIDIALGKDWEPPKNQPKGHAIELRVNAENPEKFFQPSPGILRIFRVPYGPGIRVDSGVVEGNEIPNCFDSMIAKLIAWAPTRKQAVARVLRACQELDAIVEDGATNQAFLCDILKHPNFIQASADTAWLDRAMKEGGISVIAHEAEALIASAILEYRLQFVSDLATFFAEVQDGIPQQVPRADGRKMELRLRNRNWTLHVFSLGGERFWVEANGQRYEAVLQMISPGIAEITLEGVRHKLLYSYGYSGIAIEIDGYTHPIERSAGGTIKAPAPAVVVSIAVKEGEEVDSGSLLCTLEAMKMELGVNATQAGRVKSVLCLPNQQVSVGQPLILIEGVEEESEEQNLQSIFEVNQPSLLDVFLSSPNPFALEIETQQNAIEKIVVVLRSMMLGHDVGDEIFSKIERLLSRDFSSVSDPSTWLPFLQLLEMFADCGSVLNRNRILRTESESAISADVAFYDFCRQHHKGEDGVDTKLKPILLRALRWYGILELEYGEELREALFHMVIANVNAKMRHRMCSLIIRALIQLQMVGLQLPYSYRGVLERCSYASKDDYPFVCDNAQQAIYIFFDRQYYLLHTHEIEQLLEQSFQHIANQEPSERKTRTVMNRMVRYPDALQERLLFLLHASNPNRWRILEIIVRRLYAGRFCDWREDLRNLHSTILRCITDSKKGEQSILAILVDFDVLEPLWTDMLQLPKSSIWEIVIADPFSEDSKRLLDFQTRILETVPLCKHLPERLTLTWRCTEKGERHRTYTFQNKRLVEDVLLQNIHPEVARRVELWKLGNFHLQRRWAHDRVYAFHGVGRNNPKDERIFICAEVLGQQQSHEAPFWEFEQSFFEALRALRDAQAQRTKRTRLRWNWMFFYIHSPLRITDKEILALTGRLEPHTRDLSIREIRIRIKKLPEEPYKPPQPVDLVLRKMGKYQLKMEYNVPAVDEILQELSPYDMRVVRSRRYGYLYPYEIIRMLEGREWEREAHLPIEEMTAGAGSFVEYDFDEQGNFVPTDRAYGQNQAAVVIGIISNETRKYPEGMSRVWIGSDPTRSMGALAEPECRRILAAIELADALSIPIEWIPISAGAKIAMDSGTENLDWTASVMRRLVEFSQKGGMVNIIVYGINVGAQSYWNAQANMLMHTRGILIMTMNGAMVLTGKKALDFSGSVSAEDERGIGGAERIMFPNGQAQVITKDLGSAYKCLFDWYFFTYKKKEELHPRKSKTKDPISRSILEYPYQGEEPFQSIGNIFDSSVNPQRKKTFAIRSVMRSVIDQDGGFLERFSGLRGGESSVLWETNIGGYALTLLGIESRSIVRRGRVPMDGPNAWTGGTLFPLSSKKVARGINSASGTRPVVALANLSGFDGSPESLSKLQLEFGAEIGRAVVNFEGPIIFVVIGRYHGGAYVVFSKALNPNLKAFAIEGSFASVIGGAPAAAVVFPREVKRRVEIDERVAKIRERLSRTTSLERLQLLSELESTRMEVMLEKRGEVAAEFDTIHSVERAIQQGSLDGIVRSEDLRMRIVQELDAFYQKEL